MIQANELRIGNIVLSKPLMGNSKKYLITKVSASDIYRCVSNPSDYEPIPLTEEWLLKCGFKKSITGTCYGMITANARDRFSIFSDGKFKIETTDLSIKIKYLHQLQNIYFALTSEELIIKL